MTQPHREALMSARAYAHLFIEAVDNEINGMSPKWRKKAANDLYAALENIEIVEEESKLGRPSVSSAVSLKEEV